MMSINTFNRVKFNFFVTKDKKQVYKNTTTELFPLSRIFKEGARNMENEYILIDDEQALIDAEEMLEAFAEDYRRMAE